MYFEDMYTRVRGRNARTLVETLRRGAILIAVSFVYFGNNLVFLPSCFPFDRYSSYGDLYDRTGRECTRKVYARAKRCFEPHARTG